jgi:hypothetical protein
MNNYPPVPNTPPAQQYAKDSGTAIASLICGIAAYLIVPFFGALAAIILGHVAVSQINASNGMVKGKGMATAGLVLGYVQIGLTILGIVLLVALAPAIGSVFSNINSNLGGY